LICRKDFKFLKTQIFPPGRGLIRTAVFLQRNLGVHLPNKGQKVGQSGGPNHLESLNQQLISLASSFALFTC
jgi:hypothetical protein